MSAILNVAAPRNLFQQQMLWDDEHCTTLASQCLRYTFNKYLSTQPNRPGRPILITLRNREHLYFDKQCMQLGVRDLLGKESERLWRVAAEMAELWRGSDRPLLVKVRVVHFGWTACGNILMCLDEKACGSKYKTCYVHLNTGMAMAWAEDTIGDQTAVDLLLGRV